MRRLQAWFVWSLLAMPTFSMAAEELVDQWGPFADWVTSVAVTPQGDLFIAGSYDEFRIWNVDQAKEVSRHRLNRGYVRSLAVSPNGELLALGAYQSIEIWKLTPVPERLSTLKGHRGYVTTIAFLDEDLLISGSEDKTIRKWNVNEKNSVSVHEFSQPVQSLSVAVDVDLLVVGLGDITRPQVPGKAELLHLKEMEREHELTDSTAPVQAVAISPDRNRVIVGGIDEKAWVYEIATGKLLRSFDGHSRPINTFAFLGEGRFVVSGSGGRFKGKNVVCVWNPKSGEVVSQFEPHMERVTCAATGANGTIALGSYDKTISFWKITLPEK